ncbi:MAG: hypothetical protein KBS64_06605 [Treponema sp.]|nr:hypothetical protein [Candidatus Treponema equi]
MDFKQLFKLSISVLSDWRVIFIAIFSIAFMMIGSYVVKYRKKPPRVKKPKAAPAPAAPKPEEKKEGETEEE